MGSIEWLKYIRPFLHTSEDIHSSSDVAQVVFQSQERSSECLSVLGNLLREVVVTSQPFNFGYYIRSGISDRYIMYPRLQPIDILLRDEGDYLAEKW